MAVTRRRPGGSQRSVANATQTQRLWGRPQHPKHERTLASRSSAPDTPGVEVDRTGPGMRNGPRRRLLVSPGVYHPWSVSIRLFVRTHCPSVSHVSVCPSPRLSFICHLPVVCIHPVVRPHTRPPSALVGLYVHQVSAILVTAIRPSDRSSLTRHRTCPRSRGHRRVRRGGGSAPRGHAARARHSLGCHSEGRTDATQHPSLHGAPRVSSSRPRTPTAVPLSHPGPRVSWGETPSFGTRPGVDAVAAGAPRPRRGCSPCPQTPSPRRLRSPPSEVHWMPSQGGPGGRETP